jgi:hypothetical protein
VGLGRLLRHHQHPGDLPVRLPPGDLHEDLPLALGQAGRPLVAGVGRGLARAGRAALPGAVGRAGRLVYAAAIERGYTWHEFGDVTFFFPDERSSYVRMLRV